MRFLTNQLKGVDMADENFNLSRDLLHELFEYRDGFLFWKIARPHVKIGQKAGRLNDRGYWIITIGNRIYRAHRIIFLYHYGYLPTEIDHIDNDRLNNKIENLRPATRSQNLTNKGLSNKNTSGAKNVSWDKSRNKWEVQMYVNKKKTFVGRFDDLEVAKTMAIAFRKQHHGEFANHG
jgi:hypothetical protein